MTNRLADTTSPYLQQHADNPVHWWPWCDEALETAKNQDKPILLSIGYSACHWCHVMAHESFEDEETAALMNRHFVNIKVDREERPDLDKIYQTAHQIIAQRPGGWPLTVVLDPHGHAPFFAGTYFPRQPRYGMPGFKDVLQRVAGWYAENKDELPEQKERLQEVFQRIEPEADGAVELDAEPIEALKKRQLHSFDSEYGGSAGAPKFPHPSGLAFQLEAAENQARSMALFTLTKMIRGGLYDQIGGGFCRYSVDERWEIPHFEKMLYDNGPLLALCARAAQLDPAGPFKRAAEETAEWVMREMQSPEGGYYSTLDADSEGEEGKFYVWSIEEIEAALSDHPQSDLLLELVTRHYGLEGPPNFEGKWHLNIRRPISELARERDATEQDIRCLLDTARQKLFEAREQRVRPGRDEKILTAWNALVIKGMAVAARLLGRNEYLESARRALGFIREQLWHDGRLLATYKDGHAHLNAYLDDYAFLLDALLELLQTDWRSEDLTLAVDLAKALLERFEDRDGGGFYFTAHDHEELLHRPKPMADESTPAGNAVAVRGLLRLGHLVGETRYLDAAEHTLRLGAQGMAKHPQAHASLIDCLREYLQPPEVLILRGTADELATWRNTLQQSAEPQRMVFAIPDDAADLPEALADKKPRGDIVAYRCRGMTCSAPISDLSELKG